MIIIELRNSTALGNGLTGLPTRKEGFSGGEFHLSFPTNTANYQMFDASKYVLGTCF